MTEEEHIEVYRQKIRQHFKSSNEGVFAEKAIKAVFNDFESRTCENCTMLGDCQILNAIADTGTIRLVDFGCNKFEAK